MNSAVPPPPPTVPRWLSALAGVLTAIGLVCLVVTIVLGFETPNTVFLVVSAALTLLAPMAILLHFAVTRRLTTAEKRVWMREFTGAEVWSALSEYISSPNLSASADRMAKEAAERRDTPRAR
jgi:uncharacterized membrane protein